MNLTIPNQRRPGVLSRILAALALISVASFACAATDLNAGNAGDGWQVLASSPAPAATPVAAAAPATTASIAPTTRSQAQPSLNVASVVLPGAPAAPAGDLTFNVTPQDVNLRNAMDRWLPTQGWQLAWKIDDDLPLEFNAKFSGDFTSVLTQVMQATNHMRTPTRICRHINNVIRVIARAASCKE
ncbi:toxin co-regulated pilus biosynthesis Q family protein [Paraburkholderia agricolaris]|uniref:Toxin co-regulated pilus biosynthesis Q family protein n=1 Tax=Paraburkholderia agricolaris TaxID=2152888 RepID=A0ABW8ZW19_9BURK